MEYAAESFEEELEKLSVSGRLEISRENRTDYDERGG